jgi:uncharacterized protein (TIGR02246 family)
MRVFEALSISVLTVVALSCQGAVSPEPPPVEPVTFDVVEVTDQIKSNNQKFEEAIAAGDAAAVAGLYTEEATVMPPDAASVTGREAIESLWSGVMESGAKSVDLTTLQVEGNGDLAYEIGAFTLTVQPEGQDAAEASGKYVVVWKRGDDNTWRLHVDIWNSNHPPQ